MGKLENKFTWTPVELEVMLHCYYTSTSPGNSDAVRNAIAKLRAKNMIEVRAEKGPGIDQDGWKTTEKGDAFVNALCAVPEPVAVMTWVVGDSKREGT